jgi:bacterioferritin-associated ferredoxin
MIYACLACNFVADLKITARAKQSFPQDWQLLKAHNDLRFACGIQNSVQRDLITKLCRQEA